MTSSISPGGTGNAPLAAERSTPMGTALLLIWSRIFDMALSLVSPRQQIRPDKRPQVPIQHAVDIAHLHLGAVILDQPVRMQHIRTYLRAEIDIEFRIFHFFRGQ